MKAAIHNLGCKVNSYEAYAMEQMLRKAGYEIISFDSEEPADIYIINTCSVTNIADRKSRQMLHRAKKKNPDAVVVAAGCYAQAEPDAAEKDALVDIVVGNHQKINIVDILEGYFRDKTQRVAVLDISKERNYEPLEIENAGEHTRAYIKVQDGCNQFCSYCIIPLTRGRVRSRREEDVLEEIARLAGNGFREFVITGIHLSSYGVAAYEAKEDERGAALLRLIGKIAGVEGVQRIRLGSLEPRIITASFVKELADIRQVCPHFHLSLQSGCDATLRRMNRHYTTDEYEHCCALLREMFPGCAVTTDIIVGFPGETQEEFEATFAFAQKIQFYEMHIFKYSRRKGTLADKMEGQIAEQVKAQRSAKLIALGQDMSVAYRKRLLGTQAAVLFEELLDNGYICGYTITYVRVFVKCSEIQAKMFLNQIKRVLLCSLYEDGEGLIGKIVE